MFFKKKNPKTTDTKIPCKKKNSLITGIIVGGAVGSVLSLLFAPDKGTQTRKKVASKGKKMYSQGRTKAEAFLEKYKNEVNKNIEK